MAALCGPARADIGAPALLPLLSTGNEVAASPSDSAVQVVALAGMSEGLGAGVVVGRENDRLLILTAKHVATFGAPSVRFADSNVLLPATVRFISPLHDLALLEVRVPEEIADYVPVTHFGRTPARGESLFVVGTEAATPTFERASFRSAGPTLEDGPARGRFTFNCDTCHPGESGAGVFAPDGSLVGIYIGRFQSVTDGRFLDSVAEMPTGLAPARPQVAARF